MKRHNVALSLFFEAKKKEQKLIFFGRAFSMRYSHGKFFYSIEAKAAPVLKNRGQRLMKKTESIRESVG